MGEATARAHGALEDRAAVEQLLRRSADQMTARLVELEAVDVEQAWAVAEAWWAGVNS